MRHRLFRSLAAAVALAGAGLACAQPYPSRTIRIVVPYPAGGATDVTARILAQRMGERMQQPVVVENATGAGGTLGTARVAKAAPDGYTLLLGQPGPNTVAPSMYASLPYDGERDFAPISLVVRVPVFAVVAGTSPYRTFADLVDAGRQKDLNYASAGIGSVGHLSAELMNQLAGTKFVMVHYRGSAPAITGVLGGDAALHFASGVDAIPMMRSGRLRALAVTSERRTTLVPDVPTTAEAGVPGLTANVWYGLLAPAKTPRAIVDRLHQEVTQILDEPAVRQRLIDLSAEPATSTPEEFAAMIRAEIAAYATIVKAAGIKPE